MREKILRSLVARIFMQQTRGERFVDCLVVRLRYFLSVACHVQVLQRIRMLWGSGMGVGNTVQRLIYHWLGWTYTIYKLQEQRRVLKSG